DPGLRRVKARVDARPAARDREVSDPARDETPPHRDRGAATMMRSHERIEELIAIRSIGGAGPREQAELERLMASHGPDCEDCRRLEIEYGEVAGRLAFALGPGARGPA